MENEPFRLSLSAPGKIILFGEYSVVFNKPAVAAALCLRTRLHLSVAAAADGVVHLRFSALDLDKRFPLEEINDCFNFESKEDDWRDYLKSMTDSLVRLCEKTFGKFDLTEAQKLSLISFLHCFRDCFQSSNGFSLEINSDLSVGSGVGSSASFSVLLSAAALLYESHLRGQKPTGNLLERNESGFSVAREKFNDLVSKMAFSCEKIFHGSPSGVDNNTVLHGSMLEFVKSNDGEPKMQVIAARPIKILLVNTNVQRSTKTLVENVRRLKKNHPEVVECVLRAMENVARNAVEVLQKLNKSDDAENLEQYFGELISLNHNLLRVLGVSHSTLEEIISIANKYNLNAKLTGAGGGGFAFVYLPSHVELSIIENVKKELTAAGYTVSDVNLGGPGLIIEELMP